MKPMVVEKRRRFPVWAFVVSSLLIGLPLLVFCLHLYIRSVEERRWAEMRTWCERMAGELRARDSRRPVLRGEAIPGNAWDDYEAGLAIIGPMEEWSVLDNFLKRSAKADRGKARAIVESRLPAIQALRRGASRSNAQRQHDWERNPCHDGSEKSYLYYYALSRARFLHEDGRSRDAMEVLLDTAQYAEDIARNGTALDALSGLSALSGIEDELKELLCSGTLSREDCREFVQELDLLDRSFPREAEAEAAYPMTTGFDYLKSENHEAYLKHFGIIDPTPATWRYGFSSRLVLVDAFQRDLEGSRQLVEAAGKPWKEARKAQESRLADLNHTTNPLLQRLAELGGNNPGPINLFREMTAKLRLLRALAEYRGSGNVTMSDDPFGDKLHVSFSETRLKLWSVGFDGVDDDGSGEWNAEKGKDIVLEVER